VIAKFTVDLAKRIERGDNILYMDESSCNLWMRGRYTWTSREKPVKMQINQFRGAGVTIYGAIGTCLDSPLFMKSASTNIEDFRKFLLQIKEKFPQEYGQQRPRISIVLDNHPAHRNVDVNIYARNLGLTLLFLPPYCPQLNSIECLWSVVKRSVKRELQLNKDINLNQEQFEQLVQKCLDQVTGEQQKFAAKHNNRQFIFDTLREAAADADIINAPVEEEKSEDVASEERD